MAGKVAPHEGNEIELVCNGIKPLASIEAKKDPEQFEKALQLRFAFSIRYHTNEHITFTRKENKDLHDVFALLNSPRAAMVVRSKAEKHRLMGRLFGYSEEDIEAFIKSDLQCACGQCKWEEDGL